MKLTIAKQRFYSVIKNIVNLNKISHAYLIELDDYDSDFKCVLDFVKMVLCQDSDAMSNVGNCDKCNICRQIDSNIYIDLKIIEPDGNVIKKKQLIELQEECRNKSLLNNKKIYIIKEAEKLNDSSANTILKFLEEPEDDIVAILVTTNRYKVIETILSRCQILSMQDSGFNVDLDDNLIDLISMMIRGNALFINYNSILNDVMPDKEHAKVVLDGVEKVFISYLNYISNKVDNECSDKVINLLSSIEIDKITTFIGIIEEEMKKLEYNVNYKLWLDCLFAKLIGG